MYQKIYRVLMSLFILLGVALGVRALLSGNLPRALLGFAAPAFLLIPKVIGMLKIQHPYALYCQLCVFLILAYDIGCVYQAFDKIPFYDRVSHFLSGFLFTTMGYILFLFLNRKNMDSPSQDWVLGVSYAVFFSIFVAVGWEVGEFSGFLLTGHDSQHTLTTGVFDTMYDLICCLAGSLLCAGSAVLHLKKKVKLLTGAIIEEFYLANIQAE